MLSMGDGRPRDFAVAVGGMRVGIASRWEQGSSSTLLGEHLGRAVLQTVVARRQETARQLISRGRRGFEVPESPRPHSGSPSRGLRSGSLSGAQASSIHPSGRGRGPEVGGSGGCSGRARSGRARGRDQQDRRCSLRKVVRTRLGAAAGAGALPGAAPGMGQPARARGWRWMA